LAENSTQLSPAFFILNLSLDTITLPSGGALPTSGSYTQTWADAHLLDWPLQTTRPQGKPRRVNDWKVISRFINAWDFCLAFTG